MQAEKEFLFAYVSLDGAGAENHGRILAIDEGDAKEKLLKKGLHLTALQKAKEQDTEGWFPGIVN